MAEPKPIASLSSGLLARKGAARPAMRRQGLGMGGMMSHPLPEGDYAGQDDLGWNDMGYDVDPAHEEHAPDYGNLLAGAIPDALPVQESDLAAAAAAAAAMAPPPVPPVPVVPDVVRQQAEIAERMAEPVVAPAAEPATASEEPPAAAEEEAAPAQVLAVRKRKAAPTVVAAAVETAAAAVPQGRRAAFTLRLDSDRHLRLRLAAAVTGQSAQQLVTAALDELLTKIPEIEDLAGRVPRSAGR